MEDRPLVSRILISLVTALSFLAMSLSGIAAFIVPQGRVAFWTDWTFLGLSKAQWGNIHITTSVLFLIAGIWHTCYNWTPLMQYLCGVPGRMAARWRDLAVAALLTAFFSVGAVTKTPPLNYILDFNTWIKDSWVRTPADDPPFGHAELLSLKGFCKKMYIDTGEALGELRQAGVTVTDENATLEQIARTNGMTPSRVYQFIKKLERPEAVNGTTPAAASLPQPGPPPAAAGSRSAQPGGKRHLSPAIAAPERRRYTADLVVEKFEGKGIGRKTLAAVCRELDLDCARIRQKLEAGQMAVKDDETLKDAATRLGVPPIEVLTAILADEPI